MPDPKDNAKLTGDTHPSEPDRDSPAAAREDAEDEATPGLGENQAGFVKDRDLAPGGKQER
ncbi:MAG: hypothetical protein K0R58_3099 [Ramlibacter sp.]|jgi:hypothetical protein|nr:hypothetical protein [Ramlibacter sp.]